MNDTLRLLVLGSVIIGMTQCSKEPKVITASEQNASEANTGIFAEPSVKVIPDEAQSSIAEDVHAVTIIEVLPTTRYVYLRVKEGQEEFWIATIKREVKIGETYYYQGGLLKTNFESKEHKRVFDRMYLVSDLMASDHSSHASADKAQKPAVAKSSNDVSVEGSVKIAELVANPKKYAGKTIQISGECVKVNPNIMGRNWVHIQDGSKNEYDLVITCDVQVPVGHKVTMTGKVVLDKDFGAGYQYAILLEEGQVVQ